MDGYASTLEELARAIHVSVTMLRRYRARQAPIRKARYGYHIGKLRRWVAKNVAPERGPRAAAGTSLEASARARLLVAQAREKEAKAREAELRAENLAGKRYLSLEEVKERDFNRIDLFTAALRRIPRDLATKCVGRSAPEIEAEARRIIHALLVRLSES